MRIWVKGFQRNRFPLEITDFNVSVLKGKIAQESGIPVNEQHIVFRGELLKDGDLLNGVEENDQITLLKKINDNVLPKLQPPPVTPVSTGVLPNGQPAQPLPADLQNMVNNLMNNFMRGQQQQPQQPQQPQQQQQQQQQIPQIPPQFLFGPPQAGQPPQTEQRPAQASPQRQPINSLPPIPADLLDQLVGMGFPAHRARKSLYFNRMDVERSVEWLFEHMDDADIDSPLTQNQIAIIARHYNQQPSPQVSPQPSPQASPQAARPSPTPSSSSFSPSPSSSSAPQDPEKARRQQAVQECSANNVCTFTATGRQFTPQEFYQCFTCNLAGNQGCCAVCARVCHAGHNLSAPSTTTFFCDCGAGESGKACTALTKKQ